MPTPPPPARRPGPARSGTGPAWAKRRGGGRAAPTGRTGRVAGVRPASVGVAGQPRPRRRIPALTGRAAVLALVVLAVLLMLAYPLRAYIVQRHTIAQLQEQSVASTARQERLGEEIARFDDPAFVAQKAAALGYVQPGQRRYVMQEGAGDQQPPDQALQDQNAALLSRAPTEQPWYDKVVLSLTRPGKPLPSND